MSHHGIRYSTRQTHSNIVHECIKELMRDESPSYLPSLTNGLVKAITSFARRKNIQLQQAAYGFLRFVDRYLRLRRILAGYVLAVGLLCMDGELDRTGLHSVSDNNINNEVLFSTNTVSYYCRTSEIAFHLFDPMSSLHAKKVFPARVASRSYLTPLTAL